MMYRLTTFLLLTCGLLVLSLSPAHTETLGNLSPENQVLDLPPSEEIPVEYLNEMDNLFNECEGAPEELPLRDCRCYAMLYLEKRLQNPESSVGRIKRAIENSCYDKENMTKHFYQRCYYSDAMLNPNIDRGKVCACVGRETAQDLLLLERMRYRSISSAFLSALTECKAYNP